MVAAPLAPWVLATPGGCILELGSESPPGLLGAAAEPPLMRTLKANSEELTMEVLSENPEAAKELFWDHGVEPPLCYAVRIQCRAGLVRLLLQHGAELQAQDAHGRTPLSLLVLPPRDPEEWEWELPQPPAIDVGAELQAPAPAQDRLEVAAVLAEFGADPAVPDDTGRSPADQAQAAGDEQLLRLWAGALQPESLAENPGLLAAVAALEFHAAFLCGPGAWEPEQSFGVGERP